MEQHSLSTDVPADDAATNAAAVTTVASLTGLLTLGCIALAVAHAGVTIPGLSALGPGGDSPVVPAAIAFTVAGLAAGTVTIGALRRKTWAWAVGLVVHAIVLLGASVPYRGIGSLVGILISAACIVVLVSRWGRTAFLPPAG